MGWDEETRRESGRQVARKEKRDDETSQIDGSFRSEKTSGNSGFTLRDTLARNIESNIFRLVGLAWPRKSSDVREKEGDARIVSRKNVSGHRRQVKRWSENSRTNSPIRLLAIRVRLSVDCYSHLSEMNFESKIATQADANRNAVQGSTVWMLVREEAPGIEKKKKREEERERERLAQVDEKKRGEQQGEEREPSGRGHREKGSAAKGCKTFEKEH